MQSAELTKVVILSNFSWSGVLTLSVTRLALILPHCDDIPKIFVIQNIRVITIQFLCITYITYKYRCHLNFSLQYITHHLLYLTCLYIIADFERQRLMFQYLVE